MSKPEISNEARLDTLLDNLPRELPPEKDLWPQIEAAIKVQEPEQRQSTGWLKVAAVALLVIGAAAILLNSKQAEIPDTPAVVEQSNDEWMLPAHTYIQTEFVSARELVSENLDDKLEQLPADVRGEVEENLEVIRQAIANIEEALSSQPDNVLLQNLLNDAYKSELNLIMRIDGVADNAMRRGDI